MSMYRRWPFVRQGKLNLLRFMRLQGSPDEIAKGFALGIFIGMTPTLGLQMLIAIFFAMLLRENKIAAALGVWITNPVTAAPIYALEYETGRRMLQMAPLRFPEELTFEAMKLFGWELMVPLLFGSLIYGIFCAIIAYALTLRLIPFFKTWRVPRWPRHRRPSKS
jgi:uncharacterized protein